MATYQTVMNNTWDDPVFQGWNSNTKLVFLNFITSHRHNPIGLYAVTLKTLALETSLTVEAVETALHELQQPITGYARIRYDAERSVVWIVNALKHQSSVLVSNVHMTRHIRCLLQQYVDCPLAQELMTHYAVRGYAWLFKGLGRGLEGATKPQSRLGKDRIGKDLSFKKEKKESEEKEKTDQPHQTLINRFLVLKGTDRAAMTNWQVTGAYKRHSRSALALIREAGGMDHAIAALDWGAAYFDRKQLSWTLDTIAKHLPTFAKYGRDDTLAAKHGLNRNQVDQFRKLASWLESKTQPSGHSEVISVTHTGVSDHPG